MSHKRWTFTTYENGKPVATEHGLDKGQALSAIRAAMAGEPVLAAVESDEHADRPVELAHAA